MTEHSESMEHSAEEMMNDILEDAHEMSPTIMPFANFGSDDPATDLFESFGDEHKQQAA